MHDPELAPNHRNVLFSKRVTGECYHYHSARAVFRHMFGHVVILSRLQSYLCSCTAHPNYAYTGTPANYHSMPVSYCQWQCRLCHATIAAAAAAAVAGAGCLHRGLWSFKGAHWQPTLTTLGWAGGSLGGSIKSQLYYEEVSLKVWHPVITQLGS